jgi:DNA gyrase/topoisomerase IV subunit B
MEKLRIIMCDVDVDGSHISTYTFFSDLWENIEEGMFI